MIEIKGLKRGKIEFWKNCKGMNEFLRLNQGVIEPYLERMYENFEVTSYDFKKRKPVNNFRRKWVCTLFRSSCKRQVHMLSIPSQSHST